MNAVTKETAQTEFEQCIESLSRREAEVMRLLFAEKNNRQIGKELGISHRTVEVYRGHIFEKMKVHNALSLVKKLMVNGYQA